MPDFQNGFDDLDILHQYFDVIPKLPAGGLMEGDLLFELNTIGQQSEEPGVDVKPLTVLHGMRSGLEHAICIIEIFRRKSLGTLRYDFIQFGD